MSETNFKPIVLDVGKYLNACGDAGRKLCEVEALFKSIESVDNLKLSETMTLADFVGVTRAQFLDQFVYG